MIIPDLDYILLPFVRKIESSRPKMILNEFGKIIKNILLIIPKHFNNVELDVFQIMPNHIHMIIVIVNGRDDRAPTLGKIIAYFKYESTKQINNIVEAGLSDPNGKIKKIFQRNYYEHIIRNEIELFKIREYIKNNPMFWEEDVNYA